MTKSGLSPVGVINYMTNIRTLFNAAKEEYNDEDLDDVRINHYPFTKYKISTAPLTKKRVLKPETILLIKNCPDVTIHGTHSTNRLTLGRDIFLLSFYLVGINTVDLFKIDNFESGRLTYKRSKTQSRRIDDALISIKVEPEANYLLEKYKYPTGSRVFNFYHLYADEQAFNKAANKGLKQLIEHLGIDINVTLYYARHSWATIARNLCRIPKDDIALALNHSDPTHRVTDIYLDKDWNIIDEANRKVIDLVFQ